MAVAIFHVNCAQAGFQLRWMCGLHKGGNPGEVFESGNLELILLSERGISLHKVATSL